jgi:MoaA/NifB/PqqE/SkfB family radical SAM enzyme
MERLSSLSILVGTGVCNANCGFCAGKPLRKYAPKKDGEMNWPLVKKTLEECFDRGASYLSLSSSGEPTLSPLSVTGVLNLVSECSNNGIVYDPVNLYTNGIVIGNDLDFCKKYLPLWKNLGLTTIYATVHDISREGNAKIYGIKEYPSLGDIFSRIHEAGLDIRTNLVLNKGAVDTLEKFTLAIDYLREIGVNSISTWPLRDKNDFIDYNLSPKEEELIKISDYVEKNNQNLKMIFEKYPTHYHSNKKLSLFPDGSLASSWCNR